MFDWLISGADRWAVLSGHGGDMDGARLLVAQRGMETVIVDDGATARMVVATTDTEDEAVSNFYGSLSHFTQDHGLQVDAQWTDAEVNAL